MCHRGVANVDSQVIVEILELLGSEVRPIVHDDAMWHPEAENDGLEEFDSAGS